MGLPMQGSSRLHIPISAALPPAPAAQKLHPPAPRETQAPAAPALPPCPVGTNANARVRAASCQSLTQTTPRRHACARSRFRAPHFAHRDPHHPVQAVCITVQKVAQSLRTYLHTLPHCRTAALPHCHTATLPHCWKHMLHHVGGHRCVILANRNAKRLELCIQIHVGLLNEADREVLDH